MAPLNRGGGPEANVPPSLHLGATLIGRLGPTSLTDLGVRASSVKAGDVTIVVGASDAREETRMSVITDSVHNVPVARSARTVTRPPLLEGALIALGIAATVTVGRDGSPGWQLARVLVTVLLTAATVLIVRRTPDRSRGVTAMVIGVVGTALGAGIGGPHLAKGAPLIPTTAGVLALLSGLALLVRGATILARSVSGWRRVPVLISVAVVVLPVVYALSIAVAATNVPPTSLGPQTPADWDLDYVDIAFAATDGVALSGWYIPPRNGAAIVLAHGAGSTRSAVLTHAAVLAAHGYGVLLFDARGHGLSRGRAMDFGWYGDEDIVGAVSFLAAQPEVQTIGAVGMSMGGEEVIGAAAADERIRAAVAEGATNRVASDRSWMTDEYGARGWLQRPIDWLTFTAADVLTATEPPGSLRDAVASTATPILLIAAGDIPDEARAGRYIASGAPATVELWEVPGTGHTEALKTHPVEWEARVTDFLADALGVRT
jgi:pimeloyl-ACP methyl ester carboxylesterase